MRYLILLRLLPVIASACVGPHRIGEQVAAGTSSSVTPALAATLDKDGRFVFPEPSYRGSSPARADTVAQAALAFEAGMRKRGSTADSVTDPTHEALRPCPRRYYMLPVIDRLPANLPRLFALPYTPRWVVPFCRANGTSPLSVEVADAIPVLTAANGKFAGDFNSQGEYGLLLSGPNEDGHIPLSPERAAVFAAAQTGALVAEIPEGIMTHPGSLGNVAPAKCMRWRITLDRPVRMAGQYGEYDTREVYVRLRDYCTGDPVLQVADRQQKGGGWIEYPRFGRNREIVSMERVNVVFARPLSFDIVRRVR